VEDDDILLTFYSPKLVATQREYLLALENFAGLKDSPYEDLREGARRLVESSRERLVLLDVPEHQIVELEQSGEIKEGLHIHSPGKGTVLKVGVREGQFVNPGTELYRIANLDTVWVYADVYEYELPWISVGDVVEMTVRSVPGQVFTGEIAYIFPYAQSMTRTTRVRIVFENPEGVLRPEMFADLSILADKRTQQVVIPAEAVVRSGDYEQVFVVNGEGSFEPRRVQLGLESKGEVAVLDGVIPGERVVTSAQFLIDSESKLREATAKMMEPDESPEAHDHRGMEHEGMNHEGMSHGDIKHEEMNHD
jgi:Cu(I)/Ag(I) efflux system membrane fusion protein